MSIIKSESTIEKPNPLDLPRFLPWACTQLSVEEMVVVRKLTQHDITLEDRSKSKGRLVRKDLPSITELPVANERDKSRSSIDFLVVDDRNLVNIIAVYVNDHVVKLKFEKNKIIPRRLLRIIGLTIKFHKNLQALSFNGGVDRYTIYELTKFLPLSNITDLCLDGSFLKEANYHILFDEPTTLKQLSLSRCNINDTVVKTVASKLEYPKAASKTLSILNLSSNRITDVGVKYLATALRSNRQLSYLNLASNMVDDDGAIEILKTLNEFPLTEEEVYQAKERIMAYSREQQNIVNKLMEDIKASGEIDKKLNKKTQFVKKVKGLERDASIKTFKGESEIFSRQKAGKLAENIIGVSQDPFSSRHVVLRDGTLYCDGNYNLAYLNLAYNNIGYCSVKVLLSVLNHQKLFKPKGLVNVCIEGNPLPRDCAEFDEIDSVIESGLLSVVKGQLFQKKRPGTKK